MVFSQWVEDITPLQKGCKNDLWLILNNFENVKKHCYAFYIYFVKMNIIAEDFRVYSHGK